MYAESVVGRVREGDWWVVSMIGCVLGEWVGEYGWVS